MKFPKKLYVTREGDRGEEYLNPCDNPTDHAVPGVQVKVAVYEFVGTAIVNADVVVVPND